MSINRFYACAWSRMISFCSPFSPESCCAKCFILFLFLSFRVTRQLRKYLFVDFGVSKENSGNPFRFFSGHRHFSRTSIFGRVGPPVTVSFVYPTTTQRFFFFFFWNHFLSISFESSRVSVNLLKSNRRPIDCTACSSRGFHTRYNANRIAIQKLFYEGNYRKLIIIKKTSSVAQELTDENLIVTADEDGLLFRMSSDSR